MQISWTRGFLRAWIVVTIIWVAAIGWNRYVNFQAAVQTKGDCWDRFARWPDGKVFDEFEVFGREVEVQANIDINRRNGAWAADSIASRNQWRDEVVQKLKDCEAKWPIMRRIELTTEDNLPAVISALGIAFLPPLMLFCFGAAVRWVLIGFRSAD